MPRIVAERADTLEPLARVFREHGYDGASLALISKATGLGKSSLYHFFPGGKDEMLASVLAQIDGWFETNIYAPLRQGAGDGCETDAMFDAVSAYFQSGRRMCLVGIVALGDARDRFASAVTDYFERWVEALADALLRRGYERHDARMTAEMVVAGIEGALVLARALGKPDVFTRLVAAMKDRVNDMGDLA